MIGNFFAMLIVAISCLQIIGPAFAQEKIRIAWSGASPANAAVWVLQEKRLLQKYAVDPEIIAISASPIVLQALLAGEIDVAATSVATLVSSRLAGADTVMMSAFCVGMSTFLMSAWTPWRRPMPDTTLRGRRT